MLLNSEAQVALRSIGTDALPYLVKWMAYEPPAWRRSLVQMLPMFLSQRGNVRHWIEGDMHRADQSFMGFVVLQTNAVSAIPALEMLLKDSKSTDVSMRAINALAYIGEPAIPALKRSLITSPPSCHLQIVSVIGGISRPDEENGWREILVEALNDEDVSIRAAATNAARNLAPDLLPAEPPR